eukprot:TRINITY_DN30922_c0_g1_i1.p1 TRINITY_DN30922_c0_g1~~TRINITY_DN30922_c0_g1_i1.p1  ORF type:complete len:228 (+),score=52.03 TRINITY_DN30922_c0_g1_i1:86-769(+)
MAYLTFNDSLASNLTFAVDEDDENAELMKQDWPLQYTWSLWEQVTLPNSSKNAQYADTTRQVASFSTVQEFWKLWTHVPQPSGLLEQKRIVRESTEGVHLIDSLMVFRDKVRPEWEDPLNARGGHFQLQLKPSVGGGQIDEYWNNLVLGVVGGTIKPSNMVTGLRLVDKLSGAKAANAIRIEVWFTNYHDSEAVKKLRKNVEKCISNRLDGSSGHCPKIDVKDHHAK